MRYLLGNFIEKISLKSSRLKIIDHSTFHLLHLERIPQEKKILKTIANKDRYNLETYSLQNR
ncbi:MAG: hypothetical protein AB1611_00250 [bacterium]